MAVGVGGEKTVARQVDRRLCKLRPGQATVGAMHRVQSAEPARCRAASGAVVNGRGSRFRHPNVLEAVTAEAGYVWLSDTECERNRDRCVGRAATRA
jgi:hypothetical protein